MLTIQGTARRLCDGLSRREFLRVGSLGGVGLCLPTLLHAACRDSAGPGFGKAKRCIILFLTGGPPQLDTLDPKPDAPLEIRGETRAIASCVPGIRISEFFPRVARQLDKVCLLRSLTHADRVHTSAGYTMLTGAYHPTANSPGGSSSVRPTATDHPHLGSLVARVRGMRPGVPPFASLPEVIKDAGVNVYPGQDAGFLGKRYAPLSINGNEATRDFRLPDIVLPADVTAQRLGERRLLADRLDRTFRVAQQHGALADLDRFREKAFALIGSTAVREAFLLSKEPDRRRALYGLHLFGQGCLLARRRLLEAGVGLVTVYWHYEGPDDSPCWDTHEKNFPHLRTRLAPPTDQSLAALLDDLSARGLLAETLLVCMGEFGRSPRVNAKGGREHWPHVQSILLAGAGIRGGTVHGASDPIGAYPADDPVTPPELAATILYLLGVEPRGEVRDLKGQPFRVSEGDRCVG